MTHHKDSVDADAAMYAVEPDTITTVERLLRQIRMYEGAKRTAAEQALQNMGMEAAMAIRILLEPRVLKQKAYEKRNAWLSVVSFVCFFTFITSVHLVLHLLPKDVRAIASLALLPVALIGAIPAVMQIITSLSHPKAEVQTLLRLRDKRTVPILLDVSRLVAGQGEASDVHKALTHLLPTLQAGDTLLLTTEHRQTLNASLQFSGRRVLGRMVDVDYVVAVLTALQQVGDHTALPHVERLAGSARQSRIRQAAQECLPFLEYRAMQQGQTLLHPTSRPDTCASALVRAASTGKEAAPGLLLRASVSNQERSDEA